MNIRYITIEREFGSGGTKIARCLSESTGIPCYGKEILENASKKLNMSIDEIEKYEENVTNSLLYTIHMMAQVNSGNLDMLTKEGHVFVEEQSEIQKIAKRGKAIFQDIVFQRLSKMKPVLLKFSYDVQTIKKNKYVLSKSMELKKAKWNVFENGSIREEPGIIMPILHERGMKGLFQKQSQGLSISRQPHFARWIKFLSAYFLNQKIGKSFEMDQFLYLLDTDGQGQ